MAKTATSGTLQWVVFHLPDGTTRGTFFKRDPEAYLERLLGSGDLPWGTQVEHGDFEGATFTPVATKEEFDRDCGGF